ncbi:uncharacterized protein LOC135368002 [Ornithodoros turicata]|uniref:uncharacterized protein LOC135368002 n=1 Tax=Ornithodoros turicata TaxID=34597 RepID=UPI0031393521
MIISTGEFRPEVLKKYINSILGMVSNDLSDPFVNKLIKFEQNFQQRSTESRGTGKTVLNYTSLPTFPPQFQWNDWKHAIQGLVDTSKIEDEVHAHNVAALTNVTNELFIVDSKLRVSYVSILAITHILRYRVQGGSGRDTCVSLAMKHFPVNTIYLLSEKRIVPTLQDTFTKFVKGIQRQVVNEVAKEMWLTKNNVETIRNMIKEIDLIVPETFPPLLRKDVPLMSPQFTESYVLMSHYTRTLENKYLKFTTLFPSLLRARVEIEDDDLAFTNAIMWAPWFYDQKDDTYINYATVGVRTGIALFKFIMEKSTQLPQVNQKWKEHVSCMLRQTGLFNKTWGNTLLGAAYEVARGSSVALGLASPFPDVNAKRLFFGRLCQQYCDRRNARYVYTTDFNFMRPRLLCEFSARQQPLFWEAFGCWDFKGNCSLT